MASKLDQGNALSIFVVAGAPKDAKVVNKNNIASPSASMSKGGNKNKDNMGEGGGLITTAIAVQALQSISQAVMNSASQVLNTYVSHIGDLTGQMQTQRNTQFALSMASEYGSAIVATAMATIANPFLGLATAAAFAIQQTTTYGIRAYEEYRQNAKDNYNVSILRKRSGLDITSGNGRITDK